MSNHLAKIEMVALRDGWHSEDGDFTPWLAANIGELSNALGIPLELNETESWVGGLPRRVDILATSEGRPVVIENQLNLTDNDHFSRLMIYAAGKSAKQIIWVASDFREEHRQVLDWLNQHTDEDVQFFGVVVELWKIDNSRPAPNFRVVAAPNDWRKQSVGSPQAVVGGQGILNRNFRQALVNQLRREHGLGDPRMRHHGAWDIYEQFAGGALRYAGIWFTEPAVELVIEKRGTDGPDWNQSVFEQLQQHQAVIESALTEPGQEEWFVWESVGQQPAGRTRVAIYRPGNVHNNTDAWEEYRNWIIRKVLLFREVFTPYLTDILAQLEDSPEAVE